MDLTGLNARGQPEVCIITEEILETAFCLSLCFPTLFFV